MINIVKRVCLIFLMLTSASAFAQMLPVYTSDKPAIMVSADKPEFIIRLKSNPTTGYSWFLREYNNNLVEAVKKSYEAPENKKLIGASGFEMWTFKMKPAAFQVPQQTLIRFVYLRPWENAEASAQQVIFSVTSSVLSNAHSQK